MILVIGSTGMLGSEICQLLTTKNYKVRAMVRTCSNLAKVDVLNKLGVQLVFGDIRDKSTFTGALKGISTVITTISSMPFSYVSGENDIAKVDEEGMLNLIDAARKSGVKHFIYTSFTRNINLDFPLCKAKRKVELHLQHSGMNYTILRPGYFMESWLSPAVGFDAANGKVDLCGNGTNPVAFISLKDVAGFAVECVTNPHATNTILELGGPENLQPVQVVKTFEELLKKKINVLPILEEVLEKQLSTSTNPMQKSFAGLMCCMAKGDYIDMNETLKKFPIPLHTVKDYIHQLEAVS